MKKEKGVSEVIGTLLILAITVTLFSSVFYYVSTMPAPTPQVYSSFSYNYNINTNSTLNLTITNTGGQPLMLYSTELMLVFQNNTGSKVVTHMLSEKNFSSQINSTYFGVNKKFTYHSWWDNVRGITYLTTIYVYLIDKQNSQVVWYTVLQGSLPIVKVVGFSYSPSPLKANTTQTVNFNAFVIYNQNNKVLPNVTLTIVGFKPIKLLYSSPMVFSGNKILTLNTGIYTVYVNATFNNTQSSYKGIINVVSSYSSAILEVTSISFTNPDPVHGTNDGITVTVYSTSPYTEKFNLTYYDIFRGKTTLMQISTGNPSANFTIAPFTSIMITATWLNVGGSGAASGLHNITVNISLSKDSPPVTVQGLSTNITVLPKILLIDDENVPVNSPSSVFNFYSSMFQYIDYPVDTEVVGYNQIPSVSGYDLVIWITGYSPSGISQLQAQEINNFVNNGTSLLLISSSYYTYRNLGWTGFSFYPTTFNYGYVYFSKIGNYNINMNGNVTNSLNATYFTPSYSYSAFAYYNNISNQITGIYSQFSSGARVVLLGFEFSTLYVYQQDLIMNKIMLWLSNITIRTGNDLALLDMRVSNPNPLFMEPVNLTFYVANFSPVNLTNIDLEVLIDNQPINGQPLYHINYIPGNGSYVPVNVTWIAGSPGPHTVFAYVNPYHTIQEVNYNNNGLPPTVLKVLNVRFSTLVVWIHSNGDNNNITSVTNTLNNFGVSYVFLNYNINNPPSITPTSKYNFLDYNLVILDFNRSLSSYTLGYDQNLAYAITSYLNNINATKYPYSMLFLGEYAVYEISTDKIIQSDLQISPAYLYSVSPFIEYLYGNNGNNQNLNLGFFGANVTRGYGIVYEFHHELTTLTCENPYSINILMNSGNSYAVLENRSSIMVGVVPLSLENVAGIIQNHTQQFGPQYGSISAKYLLMLNLLGSFHYTVNKAIPEVLGVDMGISSNMVMVNQYYVISGIVRNLGNQPYSAIVNAYDGSQLFNTQTVYVPALSAVPIKFIWQPQYAAPPSNPREIRFVISNINVPEFTLPSGYQPFNFLKEGLVSTPVYVFYDNFSTTNYFSSENIVWGFSGVNYYGTDTLYSGEPLSVFGPVNSLFSTPPDNTYWFWTNEFSTPSGGYALGTSYSLVGYSWSWYYWGWVSNWNNTYGYDTVTTTTLSIQGSQFAYLDMDAEFELSNGGEGVIVFASPDGGANWYWISPTIGYPGNVYVGSSGNGDNIFPSNYYYPNNGASLVPAFTTVSGGEYLRWVHYTFNLSQAMAAWGIPLSSTSSVSISFVLVLALDGYTTYIPDIYGNDFFVMDNVKISEVGTTTGNLYGDVWGSSYDPSVGYYMYNYMYPYKMDELVSVPISFNNLLWAKMDFLTEYNIWARFSYAADVTDVPNGFNLYVGTLNPNSGITWSQLDTRWAGEAGVVYPWTWASTITSVYYSPSYAFHQIGSDINLTGFVGNAIYLKFLVHGDFPTDPSTGEGYHGWFGLVEQTSGPDWVALTDVIIIGYSPIGVVSVQSVWF